MIEQKPQSFLVLLQSHSTFNSRSVGRSLVRSETWSRVEAVRARQRLAVLPIGYRPVSQCWKKSDTTTRRMSQHSSPASLQVDPTLRYGWPPVAGTDQWDTVAKDVPGLRASSREVTVGSARSLHCSLYLRDTQVDYRRPSTKQLGRMRQG